MESMYQWVVLGGAIDVWNRCQLLFEYCEATCCYGGQISPLLLRDRSLWGQRP
jgi:hypothetical protein